MDISQYMTMFLEESIENLQSLNDLLLKLEKKWNDMDTLEEIFRIAHTIKGMAGAMGFVDIVELTHKMEDVLSKFKNGTIKVTQEIITVLFICLDTLEKMIKNISANVEEKIEIDEIIKKLEEINEYADIEKGKKYNSKLNVNEYDLSILGQAKIEDFEKKDKDTNKKNIKIKEKTKKKKIHQSVRVDLEKIDNLMNMVSELVMYRTRLEEVVMKNKSLELSETLEEVGRTTSDLQDLVMKIRMLPLDTVFNRFPRMIRDISLELNKDINFIIEGAETELDRTVIDEIGEPLIHLLRNAADHGIEDREKRIELGKNPVGTIKLQAYQEGTKAIIKVIDDGAGINVESIKKKAESIGVSTKDMSREEIKNLIFAQGISTNKTITDISGRGVGMDVVKTKIAALGGTVELVSDETTTVGASFIIKLPLTLQIIQALLIRSGDETFAISLNFIDRVIGYNKEIIRKTNGREVVFYGDEIIPLVRLDEKLNIRCKEREKKFVIIVNIGERSFGLLVDSLIGQQEIVIKPLGKALKGLNEYIGATILGNGLVTLILDVGALY